MMLKHLAIASAALGSGLSAGSALAAGDFPVASCKSWNGTVVERSGTDSSAAMMKGIVTKADVQEYCERDPGGETQQYEGKLTTAQCVRKYQRQEARSELTASANCRTGTVRFRYGSRVSSARFPLGPEADTSCASGMPPLIAQFKMLCPSAARRWNIE